MGGELFHACILETDLLAVDAVSKPLAERPFTWNGHMGNDRRVDYMCTRSPRASRARPCRRPRRRRRE
eukprot:619299-Pyramimonas_sp.AAC.1